MGQARNFQNRIERLHLTTRIDQLRDEERSFNATMHIGGLFDTHPGTVSGTGDDDFGMVIKAGLGYQLPLEGKFGFRMDYSGYADFHQDFSEFDVQEHQFTIEPQYTSGQFMYSLQLGAARMLEDGRHDTDSLIILPAVTRLMNSGSEAITFYGHAAKIEDKDTDAILNEDRKTYGAGISYFFTAGEAGSVLISMGYAEADFDAFIREYEPETESNDRRSDQVVTAGLDLFSRFTPHMGFYASYSYNNVSSNVAAYDYQRHILEAGISVFY